jgi:cell division protein FtsZ
MSKQLKRILEEDVSNDLKEFGVDSDAPDLFSSETENSSF